MTGDLMIYGLPALIALVVGGAAGAVTAWRLRRPEPVAEMVDAESETDPFVDAEIDLASVQWAEANNYPPEAAGLMSARLRTLQKIGKGKGWLA